MPDEIPSPLPNIPAETTSQNESNQPSKIVAATSVVEKIRSASAKVFARHGIAFKPGRGRPKKDGSPKASDVALEPVPSPAPSPVAVAVAVPDSQTGELFRRSVASAIRGVLDFAKGLARKKSRQAGIDKEFAEKALNECEPEQQVLTDFAESLETVLKKYDVKTDYAPEIALAVSVGRLASPYWLLLQTFEAEIQRKRLAEKLTAQKP